MTRNESPKGRGQLCWYLGKPFITASCPAWTTQQPSGWTALMFFASPGTCDSHRVFSVGDVCWVRAGTNKRRPLKIHVENPSFPSWQKLDAVTISASPALVTRTLIRGPGTGTGSGTRRICSLRAGQGQHVPSH